MKLNDAVVTRVRQILKTKKMSQYKLEQITGIEHSTMSCFMTKRYKSCQLMTLALIIRGLDMTMEEFFASPLFDFDDLILVEK